MKHSLYPRLAWSGIKKNARLFVPYILAAAGTAAVFYILFFLATSDALSNMRGGGTTKQLLALGVYVVVLFALMFLFYCNSFLVRRRYKEFGLYSILGMNRGNITNVLAWETLFCALISLSGGIVLGVLLSKLAELGLMFIIDIEPDYALRVSFPAIKYMLLYFGGIFLVIFLNSALRLRRSTASDLLGSESRGEKPPRANYVFGIAGLIILAVAYYMAVSIEQPVKALTTFFAAVLMVIIATYLVFISGSVMLCRILQKRKSYYYKPQHFVSVSSMSFRMKRNGAGLASICILATMVLVMISSTVCLYFGSGDSLNARYPREIIVRSYFENAEDMSDDVIDTIRSTVNKRLDGVKLSKLLDYRCANVAGVIENGIIDTASETVYSFNFADYDRLVQLCILPLSEYNAAAGTETVLAPDEVLLHSNRADIDLRQIGIKGAWTYNVKQVLDEMPIQNGTDMSSIISTLTVVVPDFDAALDALSDMRDSNGYGIASPSWYFSFNTDELGEDEQMQLAERLSDEFRMDELEDGGAMVYTVESLAANRASFYETFGGLLFLGIMLSLVFACAAVLIIYYKQLSEGYEDAGRFAIMQKVGMTKQEIRRSINSQLLTVFFLPLLFAGLHLAFAFPFIRKLLLLFNLNNLPLLLITTAASFAVFALLYALVYKKTSNSYYKIVSADF